MKQTFSKSVYSKVSVLLFSFLLLQAFSMQSILLGQTIVISLPEGAKEEGEPVVKLPKEDPKPFIGIVMTDAPEGTGVLISSVVEGSPAKLAGLQPRDVIVQFGSAPISNLDQIRAQVKRYSIGEPVVVTFMRGGEELKRELELGNSVTRLPAVKPEIVSRSFGSADGLLVTADLYFAEDSTPKTPFIVLCHQAGWSRGEYREIAPRLNELGFNCVAIDQRSGGTVNRVSNLTRMKAIAQSKPANFVTAEQDIIAAVKWAKSKHCTGKVLLWGSSYSAALALRIAGEDPDLVDGVLAFAPGEYFEKFDKPKDWIATSAKKISVPVFITSAKDESKKWSAIFEAIPGESKTKFIPETAGNHGSRALWRKFSDSDDYWASVQEFLGQFKKKSG